MARPMQLVHSDKKRQLVEALLDKGMTLVALDGRAAGIDLPDHLRGDPQVRLNLSYRFGLPIELDDDGVRATLTFGGVPHDCVIPWPAIYLAHSHVTEEQFLFLADVPDALLPGEPVAAEAEEVDEVDDRPAPVETRPRFAVVEGGGELEESPEEAEGPPRVPHLRRIK